MSPALVLYRRPALRIGFSTEEHSLSQSNSIPVKLATSCAPYPVDARVERNYLDLSSESAAATLYKYKNVTTTPYTESKHASQPQATQPPLSFHIALPRNGVAKHHAFTLRSFSQPPSTRGSSLAPSAGGAGAVDEAGLSRKASRRWRTRSASVVVGLGGGCGAVVRDEEATSED